MLRKIFYISVLASFLASHPSSLPQPNWLHSNLPYIGCSSLLGIAAHYGMQQLTYDRYEKSQAKQHEAQLREKEKALEEALPSRYARNISGDLSKRIVDTLAQYNEKNKHIETLKKQRNAHRRSAATSLLMAGAIVVPGFALAMFNASPQRTFAARFQGDLQLYSAPLCCLGAWFLTAAANIFSKSNEIHKETADFNTAFKEDQATLIAQEKTIREIESKKLYELKRAQEERERISKEAHERALREQDSREKAAREAQEKEIHEQKQLNQKFFEDAILRNDLTIAREYERAGANVNGGYYADFSLASAMGPRHNTVFHYLTHHPSFDVNKPLPDGNTPLMVACKSGNVEAAKKLLELPVVDVNKKNKDGNTALMLAIAHGHSRCAHHIVRIRCNASTIQDSYTALTLALEAYETGRVRRDDLIIDAQNNLGRTALWIAAQKNDLAIIQELLMVGARQDIAGIVSEAAETIITPEGIKQVSTTTITRSPIMVALRSNYFPALYEILQNTAITNEDITFLRSINNPELHRHPRLNKPLFDAIANKSVQELERALKEGCDVNARDYDLSPSPLQSKSFVGSNNVLLGAPAIHKAIASNNLPLINRMLREPALDILIPAREGFTPLMMAVHMGNDSIVEAILNRPEYNTNALQNPMALAQSPINARNALGNTALHVAAQAGHVGCVYKLIGKGALIPLKNKKGFTCLDLATIKGHNGVTQLLNPQADSKNALEHVEYEEIRDADGLYRLPKKDMEKLRALRFNPTAINLLRSFSRLGRALVSALIHGKNQLADAIIKAQKKPETKNGLIQLKEALLIDLEKSRRIHDEERQKQLKEAYADLPPLVDPN